MSFNHAVVWLDHTQAHIIHFNREFAESETVKIQSRTHLHTKAGMIGAGRAPEDRHYFDAIEMAVKEAKEILIVGPGTEKLAFMKYLQKHHHEVAENVLSIETVDHPSDGQLLQLARKFFHKADLMR